MKPPKYYANVCKDKDASYSDYHKYTIQHGDAAKYVKDVSKKLGKGKYSKVYLGVELDKKGKEKR